MTLSPRAVSYLIVAGGALVAAVALQDAPLAALGIPPLLALAIGIGLDGAAAEADVTAELSLDRSVVNTGATVVLSASVTSSRRVQRFRLSLRHGPGVRFKTAPSWLASLSPGQPVEFRSEITAERPGEVILGPLVLLLSGPSGILNRQVVLSGLVDLQVRPHEDSLVSLPRSMRVRVPAGDRLARVVGEGIELAEVRAERPGERARRLNWRATARRGAPHVTLRHPEQSTDVVLFADTFEDPAVPRVIEVAAAAAAGYISRRDRVGLVCFGGVLDWVEPAAGPRQLERIRARLSATRPFFSYAWKTIEHLPPRALPPRGALVIAITPLRDERSVSAIAQLRARGHEVVVVELVDAERRKQADDSPVTEAALLLTRMEREDLRHRLWLHGIAIAPLSPGQPLEPVFASLEAVRRRIRPGVRR